MKTNFSIYTAILLATSLQNVLAITKVSLVDRTDPDYTDRCLEITGELCDYCCMVDFEWCSRDIYNCQPTFERDLLKMYQAGAILGAIMFGFPMCVCILRNCMINRMCESCFASTGGVSFLELNVKFWLYICCRGRRFSTTYEEAENNEEDDSKADEKKSCCSRMCSKKKQEYDPMNDEPAE